MEFDRITKWLRGLMYITIASLAKTAIGYLPFVPSQLTTWMGWAIMLAMTVCLFQLASANGRYRKAGIMRAIMLGCALITAFLFGSVLLTLAASVVSIIGVYQEYSAHAELIADLDSKLSRKWHSLFNWGVITALLLSFGSTAVAVIFVLIAPDLGDASKISTIVIALLSIPQAVIEIIYILYIKRMTALLNNEVS